MLKNSNFDNEFTLSPSEINDYYQEGFVVKDKVFNDNDFISFREGITKSIQNKCDNLINDGKLESDFSEEPFEKRLVKIYDHNPKAAHEILMSIWSGKFHGSGILDALRHEKLINCIQKIIGPNIIATSIYRISQNFQTILLVKFHGIKTLVTLSHIVISTKLLHAGSPN